MKTIVFLYSFKFLLLPQHAIKLRADITARPGQTDGQTQLWSRQFSGNTGSGCRMSGQQQYVRLCIPTRSGQCNKTATFGHNGRGSVGEVRGCGDGRRGGGLYHVKA